MNINKKTIFIKLIIQEYFYEKYLNLNIYIYNKYNINLISIYNIYNIMLISLKFNSKNQQNNLD